MRAFKQQQTESIDLQFIQDNVDDTLRGFKVTVPIMDGNLIEDIVIVTGTEKLVSHKLGKILTGWITTRKSASSVVWDSQSTNSNPSTTLALNSSANVTISIWVF